jgi:hypothetical protein
MKLILPDLKFVFQRKEIFLNSVRAGNYAMWPGLMTQLINKHFPDSDETQKGAHKGTEAGVMIHQAEGTGLHCSKRTAHNNQTRHRKCTKIDNMFMQIMDLTNTMHSD